MGRGQGIFLRVFGRGSQAGGEEYKWHKQLIQKAFGRTMRQI
jgi:hypothetical protein